MAEGNVSRRTALKRLAGFAVAASLAAPLDAMAVLGGERRCPKSRRCGKKCCPRHSRCRKGRCKCLPGFKKCGKKCVDMKTNPAHCGSCDVACQPGETCVAGVCRTPQQPGAVCGNGVVEAGEQCDGANLNGQTCQSLGFTGGTLACGAGCTFNTAGCTSAVCGNGAVEAGEQCDGADLNGQTCQSLGFTGGTLACGAGCTFNTSGCTGAQCASAADGTPCDDGNFCTTGDTCQAGVCTAGAPRNCPALECEVATCDSAAGVCSTTPAANGTACSNGGTCQGGVCTATSTQCTPGQTRPCYTGPPGTQDVGVCRSGTQTCVAVDTWGACSGEVTPSPETCNGLDDDCDGIIDDGFDLGQLCSCGGQIGTTVCSPDGSGTVCAC
jgi:hypothetical protein